MSANSRRVMSIGFIDVLTGFLCSTAFLMIIIKYGSEQAGDIGGGPKDYILYSVSVDMASTSTGVEDALLQLIVKKPDGEWIASEPTSTGPEYGGNGFIKFKDENFYALGPSRKPGSKEIFFHLYGAAEIKPGDRWQLGIRYYSNRRLDDHDIDQVTLQNVVESPLAVTHSLEHLNVSDQQKHEESDQLFMGTDSFIVVNVMQRE